MLKRGIAIMCCVVVSMGFVSCKSNDETAGNIEDDTTSKSETTKDETEKKTEEKVLVDDEYVKITYTGFKKDDEDIPVIKLSIENKSDQDFTVQTENVSADSQMASVYFSESPAPGKKVNAEMSIEDIDNDFQSVEGTFVLIDANYDTITEEAFQISLNGDSSTQAQAQTPAEDEIVLAEDDFVKIVYKNFTTESEFTTSAVNIVVENKSNQTIMVVTDKFYINDEEIETLLSMNRVEPGKKANGELGLYGDGSSSTIKGTFEVKDEEYNILATESVEFQID